MSKIITHRKWKAPEEIYPRELNALIDEIITEPLNDHVALARGQRLFINADDQSLICFLNGNTTGALETSDESNSSNEENKERN